jgi:heat shock protein HtpX
MGRWLMFSTYYGGYNRERRGSGGAVLLGSASMLIYFVLSLLTLHLSRLREYFADAHSASIIEEGSRKLSEGLAKITSKTSIIRRQGNREMSSLNGFKSLFISDPDTSEYDAAQISKFDYGMSDQSLVESLIDRKISFGERLIEIFSSHPNITKRLIALKELERLS